jgi:4-aminobutyrate aminotransferase-like enzyme
VAQIVPPLTVLEEQLDTAVEILESALRDDPQR